MLSKNFKGFTLIELLIVVAIIAILAAIAVPNFLEAQVRSKVSRTKADMRSITTALESYAIDSNRYPPDANCYTSFGDCGLQAVPPDAYPSEVALTKLTTPIAYMTAVPKNIFPNKTDDPTAFNKGLFRYYGIEWRDAILDANPSYEESAFLWTIASAGPNSKSNLGEYIIFGEETFADKFPTELVWGGIPFGPTAIYDPTNGTVSEGDIITAGPGNRMFGGGN